MKAGEAVVGVIAPVMGIMGLVIHIWTVVIAYNSAGAGSAILSLLFPVFAQFYWVFEVWNETDIFLNPYCITVLAYGLCFAFALGISKKMDN